MNRLGRAPRREITDDRDEDRTKGDWERFFWITGFGVVLLRKDITSLNIVYRFVTTPPAFHGGPVEEKGRPASRRPASTEFARNEEHNMVVSPEERKQIKHWEQVYLTAAARTMEIMRSKGTDDREFRQEIFSEVKKAGEALERIEAIYRGDGKSTSLPPGLRPMK
jgi:hypothetical protein